MITCRKMTADLVSDARSMLGAFLRVDEFYLDSSRAYGDVGEQALDGALELFLARPDLGFVWMAYHEDAPVGVCVVSLAISTSAGGLVAKLDDMSVVPERQGQGFGTTLLVKLKGELRRLAVGRIDTSVHVRNDRARSFYEGSGFVSLGEERLACVL